MYPDRIVEKDLLPSVDCAGHTPIAVIILTYNEESDGKTPRLEKVQDAGHRDIQVRGERFPTRITMRLHVRPFVVKVQ